MLTAASIGAISFFGIGLAIGAAGVSAGVVDGVANVSDGVVHRDMPLFNDSAAGAAFDDAGFKDIWGCAIFFKGGESFPIML